MIHLRGVAHGEEARPREPAQRRTRPTPHRSRRPCPGRGQARQPPTRRPRRCRRTPRRARSRNRIRQAGSGDQGRRRPLQAGIDHTRIRGLLSQRRDRRQPLRLGSPLAPAHRGDRWEARTKRRLVGRFGAAVGRSRAPGAQLRRRRRQGRADAIRRTRRRRTGPHHAGAHSAGEEAGAPARQADRPGRRLLHRRQARDAGRRDGDPLSPSRPRASATTAPCALRMAGGQADEDDEAALALCLVEDVLWG